MNEMTSAHWPVWCCPETGEELHEGAAALCSPSGRTYPIVDGVPRFVANGQYAESFGIQWNLFEKTQLDSCTHIPLSSDRLRRCCGEPVFNGLRDKQVLEAGCGAGRFTEVLLSQGAFVTSVDLSAAVEANARNFPPDERHRVAQADLLHLPVQGRQFDVVICLGVLQHTPNPEESIAALFEQVKPDGWLVIDHYTHERRWSNLKPLYRAWLKRQRQNRVMPAIERLVDIFLPLHRAARAFYPAWFLLCRVSPLTTYYHSLPRLPDALQREFAVLDTHDSLTDWFKHIRSLEEIEACLTSLGGADVHCARAGNGVEGRCRRLPQPPRPDPSR